MTFANRLLLGVAAWLFSTLSLAQSDEPFDGAASTWVREHVQLNTFGTLGVARLNLSGVQVRGDATATSGIGSEWTGAYDSRGGLQAAARINPELDLTWQVMLRRNGDGDFGLDTNWAYADWRPTPEWEVKLGRYMSPLYLVSDQRLVGLAQPWVRAPLEVYGLLGNVDSLDGLWLRRRVPLGEDTLMVDFYSARHDDKRDTFSVNHRQLTGLSLSLRDAHWTWHGMAARSRTHLRFDAVEPLLAVIANPALGGDPAAATAYDLRNLDPIHFLSFGLRYESDPWLVMAELAHGRSDTKAVPGSTGAYLTVGRNWGPWLGYVTVAHLRGRSPGSETRLTPGSPAAAVAELFLQPAREAGQTTLSTGLRWDMATGLALKAQVDHILPRVEGRGGLFLDPLGQYKLPNGNRAAWLYSLVLDWAY